MHFWRRVPSANLAALFPFIAINGHLFLLRASRAQIVKRFSQLPTEFYLQHMWCLLTGPFHLRNKYDQNLHQVFGNLGFVCHAGTLRHGRWHSLPRQTNGVIAGILALCQTFAPSPPEIFIFNKETRITLDSIAITYDIDEMFTYTKSLEGYIYIYILSCWSLSKTFSQSNIVIIKLLPCCSQISCIFRVKFNAWDVLLPGPNPYWVSVSVYSSTTCSLCRIRPI